MPKLRHRKLQTLLKTNLIGCEKCYVVFRGLIKSSLAGRAATRRAASSTGW